MGVTYPTAVETFFLTPTVGYVSTVGNRILKTVDGGLSWDQHVTPHFPLQGLGFATELLGWVDGFGGSAAMTTDGGLTWESVQIDPIANSVINRSQMFGDNPRRVTAHRPGSNVAVRAPGGAVTSASERSPTPPYIEKRSQI